MESNPNQNANTDRTATSKVVSLWLEQYAPEFEIGEGVEQKLNELTLNYMSLILKRSGDLADFKQSENIRPDHINSVVSSIEHQRNLPKGKAPNQPITAQTKT
jgi:hypothetical protein